ncbi:MAG: glycosyltransferase [Lachnospiraceae bacterium]|nr:glycosyltransferase [Lachnospiraceae bacterium]
MPEVSVIMGVYNCKDKDLLKKSILSVIAQTYKDWEFIICDDGSTDDTYLCLKEYEKMDDRIKIITYKKNRGLSYALNKCIQVSSGEYIVRQDDDDISYPSRLKKELDFIKNNPQYSIVGCIADVYDDNGIWGEYKLCEKPLKKTFLWSSPFLHPSVVMRKESLMLVGGYRVAKETRRCEDYDLFMRMYAEGLKGYNIQEKLYKYKIVNNEKKYRTLKYRIDEAKVRFKGFSKLNLMPVGLLYVIKPICIALIPQRFFKIIRRKQY